MRDSRAGNCQEPQDHHGTKEGRDPSGATRLYRKQGDQDQYGERQHGMFERGGRKLQAFDGRQHGDRRRDHRIAIEHGRANHAERKQYRGPPAEHASRKRGQRQGTALAVVVGTQQNHDIFDGDRDGQGPQDQRQHAQNRVGRDRSVADRRRDCDTECVERTGADVAIDDPDAADRQRQLARASIGRVPAQENSSSRGIGHETESRLFPNVLRFIAPTPGAIKAVRRRVQNRLIFCPGHPCNGPILPCGRLTRRQRSGLRAVRVDSERLR